MTNEEYDSRMAKLTDKLFDAVGNCNFKQAGKLAEELDNLQEKYENEMKKLTKEARKE